MGSSSQGMARAAARGRGKGTAGLPGRRKAAMEGGSSASSPDEASMLLQGAPEMTIDSVFRDFATGAVALAAGALAAALGAGFGGGTIPTSVLRLPSPSSWEGTEVNLSDSCSWPPSAPG